MKNVHNNQLYSSVATKKKHVGAKRYLRTREEGEISVSFSHSLGASKFDYRSLILLDLIFNQLTPISVPHNR